MDISEENVQQLVAMGFPNEGKIRRALKLGNNDLSEAVAILTNEHPSSNYDTLDDVEMPEAQDWNAQIDQTQPVYGPSLPPAYNEAVQLEQEQAQQQNEPTEGATGTEEATEESNDMEFPVANLYELEGRVFTETWSIPYKKEESLGKCLIAATKLANEGLADSDKYCRKFLDKCMPESFQKLLTSGAVHRWGAEIQEGIYNMVQLLIDLVAARLQHDPVPDDLLAVLTIVFDPECEFHFKNKSRRPDKLYWEDRLGADKLYGISPGSLSAKEPFGWLTNLVNRFAEKKGFERIRDRLGGEDIDALSMAALFAPFGKCARYLNTSVVQPMFSPGMTRAAKYVQGLEENSLKDKKAGSVCEMLASMKLLSLHFWPDEVQAIDELRLEITLRMLKAPHFNAKMNALKEITQWIKDHADSKPPITAIHPDKILEWLVENKVLSIALEGNIDQMQYCEKIKHIVDYLGDKLSVEELTKIWKMQNGQTNIVIDNIHSIIAFAGVTFNANQLEHLFVLIQKSWQVENDRMREKLVGVIGKIGKDSKVPKTTTRVLELLWDLAHLPALPTHLIELALEHHLTILTGSNVLKDQVKRSYVVKCIDDIKEGSWVLPALKQLLAISRSIAKQKAIKGILQDLNKSHDIIRQVTNSIIKFHQVAINQAINGELSEYTVVDGHYNHKDYVTVPLNFLRFILQEGGFYLHWSRARDLWDSLVANPNSCSWDRETCFEWFNKGIGDLDQDTQSQLFTKEILRLDPATLSKKGFDCFKCFFETVNNNEHRLKRTGMMFVVEKPELVGLNFLWEVCLSTTDDSLTEEAIKLLLQMSYQNLTVRLKRDQVGLHKKFVQECYTRLEVAMSPLGGSSLAQLLAQAAKVFSAAAVPGAAAVPSPSKTTALLNIERLLLIAERYVVSVEEHHTTPRTILPHGASYHGTPLLMYITSESPKMDFSMASHSNESLSSVRERIAYKLKHTPEQVQIVANDQMLGYDKDQKLLHQLEFDDSQVLSVRAFGASMTTQSPSAGSGAKQTFDLEQEKMLPGVVMAMGGQVFEMLYQLADLDEPRITSRARNLLKLIPTDPLVNDKLDSVVQKLRQPSPDESSPKLSPRASPRKYAVPQPPAPKSTKEMLKLLFDATAQGMSSFRVLYNLEVLSSKLMPTLQDAASRSSSLSFCEQFLEEGGLDLVLRVLQKEGISPDVDYETRQGCYTICLQLLRYLLCGQHVTEESAATSDTRSEPGVAMDTMHMLTVDVTPTSASKVIQMMGVGEFTDTVACFMRVGWAAAAGRLHLASTSQPIKDSSGYNSGSRSRQSSAGSTASSGSETEVLHLQAGVCVRQSKVSARDALIAKEAIEILVTCLQLRSQLLSSFYSLPCVGDFIIDVLVGCSQNDIREVAQQQFYLLSQTHVTPGGEAANQMTAHKFMLHTLLKARLPFWVPTTNTRGASQRQLKQCRQYFTLRCQLMCGLTEIQQQHLQVAVQGMLEDELSWLGNFVPSSHQVLREVDNQLLAGHLRLVCTILTCEGVSKVETGKVLIPQLLRHFLFPSSVVICEGFNKRDMEDDDDFNPKCSDSESRSAAFEVLTELANGCPENQQEISLELISMHHHSNTGATNEWEYMPAVESRASCGYVGLKNGGATCYMNSVLQQLYMLPGITESILGVDGDHSMEDESVFHQIQQMFGHLQDSRLQYTVPEKFWQVFKLWGQPINIREQQDAFDFYTALVDQLDEQLKGMEKDQIFKKKFKGVFSDQKICKDCPHRYEREEEFYALNVTVKNAMLQDSLAQFVKGELLDGDNAYFCEKCGEKRNTVKRMCIKTLPPVLCIQLKRFGYDWETNRALKFDDHFEFPWILDMEPYTAEGVARRESVDDDPDQRMDTGSDMVMTAHTPKHINYELVGVVVHSGQANAGHYYSFIKDRRGSLMSNPNKGKWYKFNDDIIEEFELNDATLENECFGGTYKAKVYDQSTACSTYPEDRVRYWSGYLLFYERMEEPKTPVSAKKSRVSRLRSGEHPHTKSRSDSFVELTELIHKGERRGLFTDKMPANVQQKVRDENLQFMRNRDIYDLDYFTFIRQLVSKNIDHTFHDQYDSMCLQSIQLAIRFMCNTYLRTKKKLRADMDKWIGTVERLVQQSKPACMWLVEFLAGDQGSTFIKPFLLECPNQEIRAAFGRILERTLSSFFQHGGVHTHKMFNELVEHLLCMLNKDVVDSCKQAGQYFWLLSMYVQMGTKACAHMFGRKGFPRLAQFLLGPSTQNNGSEQDPGLRRWSSIQARDFGPLHTTLAILIMNCDLQPYRTQDPENSTPPPTSVVPQILLKMQPDMQQYVFGAEAGRYIREVVMATREVSSDVHHLIDMLVACSYCNAPFSMHVLKNIMLQYMGAPSNELKGLFNLLHKILCLEDPLQLRRLQCVIDSYVDEERTNYDGLLAVIKIHHSSESRRSYQCIKFLVSLASECTAAKDYLLQTPTKWQWAVRWLNEKMTDRYWTPQPSSVMSNEDSDSRTFQRTISAQHTLDTATELMREMEASSHETNMDISSEDSNQSQSEDRGDQVSERL